MKQLKLNKGTLISLILFIVFVLIVAVNQLGLIERINTVQVVHVKNQLKPDHIISEKDIFMSNVKLTDVTQDMVQDKNDVIGTMTTTTIDKNSFVTYRMLDLSILKPTKDNEFIPIPNEWIYEIQGSLRRYDLVNIVAVKNPNFSTRNGTVPNSEIIKDYVYEKVPVVYVKDGRNSEVEGQNGNTDRLKGSNNPQELELSLTLEQFKRMEELYNQGYVFVFAY
ncbi:SAF domain-containing protein [Gottfriedia solisilvae]|uniref:SAF domain-containing protein n=1 Tax=Gottfriedia solisilvae TaxID=1516104 RepID=UPI003D2F2FD0